MNGLVAEVVRLDQSENGD